MTTLSFTYIFLTRSVFKWKENIKLLQKFISEGNRLWKLLTKSNASPLPDTSMFEVHTDGKSIVNISFYTVKRNIVNISRIY